MARRCNCRLRVECLEDRVTPMAGQLDPSFGVAGKVTTQIPYPSDDVARGVAVDSQSRVLVAGSSNNGANDGFVVARYTTGGALDTSFGGTGVVTVDFGAGASSQAYDLAIDAADRVVIVGTSTKTGNFEVVRVTASGDLDPTFGVGGKQSVDFLANDIARGVSLDSAGRIVVVGSSINVSTSQFAIARLTPSGALDSTFGSGGKQYVTFGLRHYYSYAYDVAVDLADRIVVVGQMQGDNTSYYAVVVRLTSAGQLDTSFDEDGKWNEGSCDIAKGVAIDSAGRVLLVAEFRYFGYSKKWMICRLNTVGSPDPTFGNGGVQDVSFPSNVVASDLEIDASNRVLAVGFTIDGTVALSRLTPAGALDTSFGANGIQTFSFGSSADFAYGIVFDPDARAIVVGASTIDSTKDFALARLTPGGTFDSTFHGDGKLTTNIGTSSNSVGRSMVIDHQARVVVAGSADAGFAVARYSSDGALDASFGGSGIVKFSFDATWGQYPTAVAVDSADRILVAGYANFNGTYQITVARLTASGSLDPTFDSDGKLNIPIGIRPAKAYCIHVDSADRILLGGSSNIDVAIVRLTTSGALDPTFDSDGITTISFGASVISDAYGITVDNVGRVIVVGQTHTSSSNYQYAVARLTTTGALDSTFDTDGKRTFDISLGNDVAYGVAVDSNDRIIVAGGAGGDFGIIRLLPSGTLDAAFNGNGKQIVSFGNVDVAYALSLDGAGRVLAAGSSSKEVYKDFGIVRLTPSGDLDTTFDTDGKQTLAFDALDDVAYGVAVDTLGRTTIAGFSQSASGNSFAIARLRNDTPCLESLQINDGSAQRSRVTSLQVTFDRQMSLPANPADAFQLKRQSDNADVTLDAIVVGNSVTLTFKAGPLQSGSLADGRYTLTAFALLINGGQFDGDNDGIIGGDYLLIGTPANSLFRLFGDADGNGIIDMTDFGAFRTAFGTSGSFFSFDGAGPVDLADFGQFRSRFGMFV